MPEPAPRQHAADHPRRRRRSASLLPPLPSPTDIPDDVAGRVEFLTSSSAPDIVPAPTITATESTADLAGEGLSAPEPSTPTSWLPVGILAAAMAVIFVVGLLLTH